MNDIFGIIHYKKNTSVSYELSVMASALFPSAAISQPATYLSDLAGIVISGPESGVLTPFTLASGKIVFAIGSVQNTAEILQFCRMKNGTEHPGELIGVAYEQLGQRCTELLKGHYAFVIYDPQTGHCTFGRDNSGRFPLFYSLNNGEYLAFSSDIRALLALPMTDGRLNNEQMLRFLTTPDLQSFPGGKHTIYNTIDSIPPENCIVIRPVSRWTCAEEKKTGRKICLKLIPAGFWPE